MIIRRTIGEKGQVVIPRDIRKLLGLREKSNVIFEVLGSEVTIKPEQDTKKFLEEFFTIARTKSRDLTLKDLKKIKEESYDLP